MPLADQSAPLSEVALAIGRSEIWLRRNWLKLHEAAGFPRKHPSGWTWPRAAVEAWLRAEQSPPALPQPANSNSVEDAYAAMLAQHYGGRT